MKVGATVLRLLEKQFLFMREQHEWSNGAIHETLIIRERDFNERENYSESLTMGNYRSTEYFRYFRV